MTKSSSSKTAAILKPCVWPSLRAMSKSSHTFRLWLRSIVTLSIILVYLTNASFKRDENSPLCDESAKFCKDKSFAKFGSSELLYSLVDTFDLDSTSRSPSGTLKAEYRLYFSTGMLIVTTRLKIDSEEQYSCNHGWKSVTNENNKSSSRQTSIPTTYASQSSMIKDNVTIVSDSCSLTC